MNDRYVIVRTYSAGVHAGILKSHTGGEVTLTDARRIWYWKGAASLSELSQHGIYHDGSKIPCAVPEIVLTEAIEVIPCSDKARESIVTCPEWTER